MKTAVVTGAGRGIGRALLDALVKKGYQVVALVRSADDVQVLASVDSERVFPFLCDITDANTEEKLSAFLTEHFESIDLLVNNAGFGASAYGIAGLKLEELQSLMEVHCYGPIRCIKACLPLLRASTSPSIVNISSRFGSLEWVASKTVPPDQATYAYRIAKAAMNMLTSCLAAEFSPEEIRVLSIDPGKVKTRFGPRDADVSPEESAQAILEVIENNSYTGTFVHAVSGERVPW